jgi:FtsH-binding integral membrane protein
MAKIFFAGCVSLAIVFAIKTFMVMNPWVELIISAVIGIVFYTIFVLQTKSVTRDEIYLLKSINLPIPKNFIKVLEKLARK